MQFKVPQFIDVEDKLFGPFTFKQFAYMAGGAGLIFVIYKVLPLWIGIFLILPIGILSALLTFYRINNKPFIDYLQAGVSYFMSSRLYIWKQRLAGPEDVARKDTSPLAQKSMIPTNSENRIKEMSHNLDIQ